MKEISSKDHPLIKHWKKLAQSTNYRKKQNRVLIYGKKVIKELLDETSPHVNEARLITSDREILESFEGNFDKFLIPHSILKKLSGCEGKEVEPYLAEIDLPSLKRAQPSSLTLVIDRFQDPGNLGTLIRSAHGFFIDQIILITPCCDPFNDKALRAAKGSTFKIPLTAMTPLELVEYSKKTKTSLIRADLKGEEARTYLAEKSPEEKIALIIGNESEGPHSELIPHSKPITLHMNPNLESLNAALAGGILCYLLSTQSQGDLS